MWFTKRLCAVLFLLALAAGAVSGQTTTDPYEILNKYFEASGGLEKMKAEQTSYMEGTLSIGTMQGTIKIWMQIPDKSRIEFDLGIFRQTMGDNGDLSWVLDGNGKLQKITKSDEATLKRKEVKKRMALYEYADPASDIFTVTYWEADKVGEKDCHVVKITNHINADHAYYYINVADFKLEKAIAMKGEESSDTFFGDYREVDGLLVPFFVSEVPYQTGQAQEIRISRYESNPDIPQGTFDPPAESAKDYEFTSGAAAENIPFKFIGNHLYIPATVNGLRRLWVLDTGAAVTVVNKPFADEIGLKSEGSMTGRDAGGTVEASFAVLPSFEVEGIHFKEQTGAILVMSELVRRLGVDLAGVFGYDFLSRFVTKVDYASEQVSFYDPEKFSYSGNGHLLDVHMQNNLFQVSATLDGVHDGIWLFDLGASMTHLDGCYALREDYTKKNGVVGMGHGAGNPFQTKTVRCDSIEFAGFTVYEPEVTFSYGGTDTVFTADKLGILGNSLFRHFVLYIDYGNERVIVEKGADFAQAGPRDRSGLSIARTTTGKEVEVIYVSPDTPAQKAGFVVGDILKSINSIGVEHLSDVSSIRDLFTEAAGTRYEVVVNRAGQEQKLKLKLAELY